MGNMPFKRVLTCIALATLGYQSYAGLIISPTRCADDNLPQWAHDLEPQKYGTDAPVAGTARGRQAWWKVCQPNDYRLINRGSDVIGTDAEFDPTANHNNGTHTRWYPTFGVIQGNDPHTKETVFTRPGGYLAPTTPPPTVGDPACAMPAHYELVGMCASGCVTPDQEISTPYRNLPIAELEKVDTPLVFIPVLGQNKVESYAMMPVERFIKDGTESLQKIVIITTQSGVQVRTSLNHPLLTQDYTMRRAQDLKSGDSLIRANGRPDVIVDVSTEEYFGKLHNLTVATSDLNKSLYLVNGYISGDKKYQDMSLSDVNRRIFRSLVK